jgi:hypothetical protein
MQSTPHNLFRCDQFISLSVYLSIHQSIYYLFMVYLTTLSVESKDGMINE